MSAGCPVASGSLTVARSLTTATVTVLLAAGMLIGGCAPHQISQGSLSSPKISHDRLVPGESVTADLDGDGALEEVFIDPQDHSLCITDGATTYHSRARWRVVQAVLGDTDHDGLTEVVTLLDSEEGRHLGLFAYFGGEYRERLVTQPISPSPLAIEILGQGSAVQTPASAAAYASTGDLVVLIQEAHDAGTMPQRTLLRWNGFGYTRIETAVGL